MPRCDYSRPLTPSNCRRHAQTCLSDPSRSRCPRFEKRNESAHRGNVDQNLLATKPKKCWIRAQLKNDQGVPPNFGPICLQSALDSPTGYDPSKNASKQASKHSNPNRNQENMQHKEHNFVRHKRTHQAHARKPICSPLDDPPQTSAPKSARPPRKACERNPVGNCLARSPNRHHNGHDRNSAKQPVSAIATKNGRPLPRYGRAQLPFKRLLHARKGKRSNAKMISKGERAAREQDARPRLAKIRDTNC